MVDHKGEEMQPFGQDDLTTPESNIFEFVYEGPDVNNGTMDAKELLDVLTGLTRAFSTVAHEREVADRYELRINDIESGSIRLIFEAIAFAKSNPPAATAVTAGAAVALNAASNVVSGLYKVVIDLAKFIDAKRRTKGARLATVPASFIDGEVRLTLPDDLDCVDERAIRIAFEQTDRSRSRTNCFTSRSQSN